MPTSFDTWPLGPIAVLARLRGPERAAVAARRRLRTALDRVLRSRSASRSYPEPCTADGPIVSPGRQLRLADRVVRARPGHPDREQDDRRVHDVAAVAAPVPRDQRAECRRPGLAGDRPARRVPRANSTRSRRARTRRTSTRRGPGSIRRRRGGAGPRRRERDRRRPGERPPEPAHEARRQATSGPIPISRSSGSPNAFRKKL